VATEVLETADPGPLLVGVRAFRGSSAYLLSIDPLGDLFGAAVIPPEAEFVPGEVLVKMKASASGRGMTPPRLASRFQLREHGTYPGGLRLLKVAGETEEKPGKFRPRGAGPQGLQAATIERIRRLRLDPAVAYAEPNYIYRPQLTPGDQFFPLQWHYQLINLPQAWDITVGDDAVVVAVLDTGTLAGHPDLGLRLTPGFDFISDPASANDGDGIDADPTDPGDDPAGASSSFHGTHVAGLVGAATDNLIGVAATGWAGRVMPLRVIGVAGASSVDISQAILYAAGQPNNSGSLPARPADVINMSFAGPAPSQTVGNAIQAARAAGTVVVAAAGNGNSSAPFFPAAHDGVISVSAVDLNAQRASYSNFGGTVDVAAPGGDTSRDLNGDGQPDGVLSTLGNDAGATFYRFQAGTSMAAPHVAGVIALMKAVYPALAPNDVDLLLSGSHPGTPIRITRDLAPAGRDDLFGHGLIDASLAVRAASALAGADGNFAIGSLLHVSLPFLDLQDFLSAASFEVTNGGTAALTVSSITSDVPWLSISPTSGTAPFTVQVTADRRGLAPGDYLGIVTVHSDATLNSPTAAVEIAMSVGDRILGNIGPAFVLLLDQTTLQTVAQARTDFAQGYAFRIPAVPPGSYLVSAGSDRDGDGLICDIEDACGTFPGLVTVAAGAETGDIIFAIGASIAPQSLQAALAAP
jgi:serine protease